MDKKPKYTRENPYPRMLSEAKNWQGVEDKIILLLSPTAQPNQSTKESKP